MSVRVTLSFDNGPHGDVTPMVLDVLEKYSIYSTFFVVGKNLESQEGQALIKEAHSRGHWIGNHTYHHSVPFGRQKDAGAALWEITRTDELIGELVHPRRYFRPYGQGGVLDDRLLNDAVVDFLRRERRDCVIWNAVPKDWLDPAGWVATALDQIAAQRESLVVLHDIATGAMSKLEEFIERTLSAGAQFRQDMPDQCVIVRAGAPTRSLASFTTGF
jgi:peptidoglycan/xylan/chitin deacetylase (PgdA/CDA1 family)